MVSKRCRTERPKGPGEVHLGKDLKVGSMLKEGLSVIGSEVTSGITGGGQDGCLACYKRQVVSLFGVMPPDNSIQQTLPVCHF